MSQSIQIVNGYPCHNCTEIDLAKRFIDPAHPKDGPYGKDSAKNIEKRKEAATLATTGNVGTKLHVVG